MKIIMRNVLICVVFMLLLAGCSDKGSSAGSKNDTGSAEKAVSDHVTVYMGVLEEEAIIKAQEFEKETGIRVDFVRMSGGEILSRIRAEKENPKASVWYGGPADSFIAAANEGLLEKYVSKTSPKISEQFKDPEGYWTGIYQGYLGFVCDGRYFDENNIDLPKSWDDLLKPEFKGNIIVANPGSSGTAYTFLSTMVQLTGEEKALSYMGKLHKQIKQYTKSGSAPAKSAALGECAIGITFLQNGLRHIKEGFENVKISAPEEGTGYEIGAVGIIKGAPEFEAAKIFVDWSLTKETQEIGQKHGSYHFLTNVDANPPAEAAPLKSTKLINYDFSWSGANKGRLVEAWNNAIKE